MARVTIIADDAAVYVDGEALLGVDLSTLDPNIHAVQWYDDPNGGHGEIEYKIIDDVGRPNDKITDFLPFQPYVNSWNVVKTAADAAAAQAVAKPAGTAPVNVIAN